MIMTITMRNLLISCFVVASFVSELHASTADSLVEPGSRDNSDECSCYLTSGPDPGFFQYHRFFDFRNIPNDGDNDYTVAPPLITELENYGGQPPTSAVLNSTFFTDNWKIQDGEQGSTAGSTVVSINSFQNVYISRNSTAGAESQTYLTLRISRLSNFMSIAEIDSNQRNLLHSSIRARMRLIPNGTSNASAPTSDTESLDDAAAGSNASHPVDPGAVLGLFTYYSDTEESDIEILSRDPITHVRYSNQPDYDAKTDSAVEGASTEFIMPADGTIPGVTAAGWTEWLDHRIDWFDGVSRWYINDVLVLNKTINVPETPSGLILNLWGDGGPWSGNMSIGGQVTVGVQWIQMLFNISGDIQGPGKHGRKDETQTGTNDHVQLWKRKGSEMCQVGCSVDGVQSVGFPEVAFNATTSGATRILDWRGRGLNSVTLGYAATMLSLLWIAIL